MKLRDIIANLDDLEDDLTIYIAANSDWSLVSSAIVTLPPDDGGLPPEAASLGMEYFLEVAIAKEVLEDWANLQSTEPLTLEKKCEVVMHYAKYDAYLPV